MGPGPTTLRSEVRRTINCDPGLLITNDSNCLSIFPSLFFSPKFFLLNFFSAAILSFFSIYFTQMHYAAFQTLLLQLCLPLSRKSHRSTNLVLSQKSISYTCRLHCLQTLESSSLRCFECQVSSEDGVSFELASQYNYCCFGGQ